MAPVSIGPTSSWATARASSNGVTIGADAVIGAGSVVTSSIPEGVIAAGNPGRDIREL